MNGVTLLNKNLKYLKKEIIKIFNTYKKLEIKDIWIYFILPIVTFILFLLPKYVQDNLAMNLKNPKVWQFITSAYVHKDFSHFFGNISLYIISILLLIFLAKKSNLLKRLERLMIITLILLPVLSSLLSYYYPIFNLQTERGASGLVSAVLGFIPALWFAVTHPKMRTKLYYGIILPLLFVLYLSLSFTYTYIPKWKYYSLILIIIFLISFILLFIKNQMKFVKNNFGIYFISIISISIFFSIPITLFPKTYIINSTLTNFITHYIGIMFGVGISFIFFNKYK